MKREVARRDFAQILTDDFDRVVLAHGDIASVDGRDALLSAYPWLWPRQGSVGGISNASPVT